MYLETVPLRDVRNLIPHTLSYLDNAPLCDVVCTVAKTVLTIGCPWHACRLTLMGKRENREYTTES